MFNEITMEEQFKVDGGVAPLIAVAVGAKVAKGIATGIGLVLLAGTVKGCTDEASK